MRAYYIDIFARYGAFTFVLLQCESTVRNIVKRFVIIFADYYDDF